MQKKGPDEPEYVEDAGYSRNQVQEALLTYCFLSVFFGAPDDEEPDNDGKEIHEEELQKLRRCQELEERGLIDYLQEVFLSVDLT